MAPQNARANSEAHASQLPRTDSENKWVFSIVLNLGREMELSSKDGGREFQVVGAEKQKLRFPKCFVRTRGIISRPDVLERREEREGTAEIGVSCEERYLGAIE